MPTISFDILIPTDHEGAADRVAAAFKHALALLVEKNRLSSGDVARQDDPAVSDDTVAELRAVYERDHEGEELGPARMHRYLIDAAPPAGERMSYNSLAMGLSRILNPKVDLPADRVALERQDDFEAGAVYPWTVEIRR